MLSVARGKDDSWPRRAFDVGSSRSVRQKAGIDLARHWTGAKLCRAGVATERKRIADQRRAVGTAEDERFVRLDAVTLGAAFHLGGCGYLSPLLSSCLVNSIARLVLHFGKFIFRNRSV